MRKLMVFAFTAMLMVGAGVGCDKNKSDGDMSSSASKSDGTMKASTDACSHCPGTQTAKADGTCSKCGMKVKG